MSENPELWKYRALWAESAYRQRSPGQRHVATFLNSANVGPQHTVVDFGCGTGRGGAEIAFRTGARVISLDFVDGCMDEGLDSVVEFRQADLTKPLGLDTFAHYGYCTDVMEHIPASDVDAVLANILHNARRVFFVISCVDEVWGDKLLDGEKLHITIREPKWWIERIESLLNTRIISWQWIEEEQSIAIFATAWATVADYEHTVRLNVEDERVRANIHANLALGLKEVAPHEEQQTEVLLLCGGPSLADGELEIKDSIRAGAAVVTVNGAYNWAIEHGITPGAQVIVDAREFNRRFVEPTVPGCRYLVSSQCDGALVASLPADQVYLWHSAGDLVFDWISEYAKQVGVSHDYYPVPGGTTVALRAIPLLVMLGFRRIGIWGLDSCYAPGGAHHAYHQPENDNDGTWTVEVNGREFSCAPWMVKQAAEFQDIVKHLLSKTEVELAVHGDGLIAAILDAAAAANKE